MTRTKVFAVVALIVVLIGATVLAGCSARSVGAVETKPVAAVTTVELAPANDWTADEELPYLVGAEAEAWIYEVLGRYGLELGSGVTVWLTDVSNCGSEDGGTGTGGGCFSPSSKMIRVSPTTAGTEAGEVILLHEYAHSVGIMDECAAEDYAHSLFQTNLWGYPKCSPGWTE